MPILTNLFGIASAVLPAPSTPPPSAPLNECFCFGCGPNNFPRGTDFFCAISTTTCNVDFGNLTDGCFNSYSSTAIESAGGCAFCECSRSAQGAFSGSCVDTPKLPPFPPFPPSPPPPKECECLSCNTTAPPLYQPGLTCFPPVDGECSATSFDAIGQQSCFANAYPNSSSLLPPPPSSPPANIDLSLYNGTWTGSDAAMSASSGGLVISFKTVTLVATSDGALRGTVNYSVVDGDAFHDGQPTKTGQESVFGMIDLVTGEIGLVEAAEQGVFTGSISDNGDTLHLLQLQSAISENPSNNQSASNGLVALMNLTRTDEDTLQMRPISLKTVLNTAACTGEWRGTDHAYSLSKGVVATIKTVRLVCDIDGGVTGNMSYFIVNNETGTDTGDNPVANDTEAVIGLFDESDSGIALVEHEETGHYLGKIDANGDLILTQTQTKVSLNAEISQPASNALVAQIHLTKVVQPGIDVAVSPRNAIIVDPTWCTGTWRGKDDAFSVSLDRVLVADKKLVLSCNVYGDLYGFIQYTIYDGSGFDHHGNAVKGDIEYVGGQIMLSSAGEYSFALVKAQKQGRFQGKFIGADISLLQLQTVMLSYEPSGQTASNGIVAFMHLTKDILTSCNCECETGMCLSLPPSPPLPPVNPSPLSPPPPSPPPSPPPPPSTPPKSSSSNAIIAVAVAVPVGILLVGGIIIIVAL